MFESGIFAAIKALMMKSQVQRFGKFLSGMAMPNIVAPILGSMAAAVSFIAAAVFVRSAAGRGVFDKGDFGAASALAFRVLRCHT